MVVTAWIGPPAVPFHNASFSRFRPMSARYSSAFGWSRQTIWSLSKNASRRSSPASWPL